jgi:hypothetical protein
LTQRTSADTPVGYNRLQQRRGFKKCQLPLWSSFPQLPPSPSGHPALSVREEVVWRGAARLLLRCPFTHTANGQQHSSCCFVCHSQYHGLVQGGAPAPAPATGGPARGPRPAFFGTKEMRINSCSISDPERKCSQPRLWSSFPQLTPPPSGHPALFGREEVVWRGAARCSVVR